MTHPPSLVIVVLGASGLIGEAVCRFLLSQGRTVVPVARRFTPVQKAAWAGRTRRLQVVDMDPEALRAVLAGTGAQIVVNCIGALQDAPGLAAMDANRGFVERLVEALAAMEGTDPVLVHVSVPGEAEDDRTEFSRGKRQAEQAIQRSGLSWVILRPGFVLADAAFGGSALMRALAVLPFALPEPLSSRPFAVTGARDIARTVAFVAQEWQAGRRSWNARWDVMEEPQSSAGEVLDGLAARLAGPRRRLPVPEWMLAAASLAGDLVSRLGWRPPVRSTALAEMRRGVSGDPQDWRRATGIDPLPREAMLGTVAATIQDRWFARLYLLKAVVFFGLAIFWIVSGLVALTVAFEAAVLILTDLGFGRGLSRSLTVATGLMDMAVGGLIAHRRTCRAGLLAGIGLSVLYMASATLLTPDLWLDPLGPLVKVVPALILMEVGLAIREDR